MYGLPDQPSDAERRDRFERELYDDSRPMRLAGLPILVVGVVLWAVAVPAGWVIVGALAGVTTGLGLVMLAVGSRWLARKNADTVYRVR